MQQHRSLLLKFLFPLMIQIPSSESGESRQISEMAQLNDLRKINTAATPTTPRARTPPTFEQLLQGDASSWVSSPSPTLGKDHDHGDHNANHNKKSVLTIVKEKAKKMKNSLSKKKHGHEDNESVLTLDDDEEDDDPEYLGAPMYESELAPEPYKETARQHPRATPVVSEKHVLHFSVKNELDEEKDKLLSPNKTITETVSEKLGPAYTAVSDATHAIASKIAGLTVATTETGECEEGGIMQKHGRVVPQTWDKGVSVKEYFMQKFEPGEDERALSQVITEAISPRRSSGGGGGGDVGVVEKVKEAVTSLLRNDEPSSQSATRGSNLSSSPIPVSTNPHQVTEEENHGRILQAN